MGDDALACPQCGAALLSAPDEGAVDCGHCGSRLYVRTVRRRHEWVVESLTPREAAAALRRALSERETGGTPEIRGSRLVYFPFTRSEGPHGPLLAPAASTLLEDLQDFRHPPGDRRGFEAEELARRGEVIAVEGEPDDDLLHVPFHVVRFRLAGRNDEQEAWVDAQGGRVLFEAPPPSRERDLDVLYAVLVGSVLAAMIACARLLWSGGLTSAVGAVGLAACLVRGQTLIRAAMRKAEAA